LYNDGGTSNGIASFTYDDTATSEKFAIEATSDQTLVRITQTGSGNSFVVEDSTSPDATPFTINNVGRVGIRIAPSSTYDLYVGGAGRFNSYLESQEYRATQLGSPTDAKFTRQTDTDTGMYFPAADNLGFTTGGTLAFEINSSQQSRAAGVQITTKSAPVGNTIASSEFGTYIYWTAGSLNFPASACAAGTVFTVINNTGASATPSLGGSNSIASGWTAHAAMDDETARTYVAVASGSFIYIG
jgi:hypothetical protein